MGIGDSAGGLFFRGDHALSTIDVDECLRVLSDPDRRTILEYLASTPEDSVPLEAIVDHLAGEEPPGAGLSRTRAETTCYHQHLPMLQEQGLIDFDPRTRDVRYRRHVEVEHLLDAIDDVSR